MSAKKYKNPPIVEAVCEFRFPHDTAWDTAIPGIIYEQIKNLFPIREPRAIQQWTINPLQGEQTHRITELAVFRNKTRDTLIQIGNHLLAINQLKPYAGWENFNEIINLSLEELKKAINPNSISGFERIALRYINLIETPKDYPIEDFFNPTVTLNKEKLKSFEATFLIDVSEIDQCKVQFKNEITQSNVNAYLLDIDYFLNRPKEVKLENVRSWLENAHKKIYEIFDSCTTNKTKDLFD